MNVLPGRDSLPSLTVPPQVLGEVGQELNYDEQVVYRDDAIRPAYLVIYELAEEAAL